jgi:hypothetical protein
MQSKKKPVAGQEISTTAAERPPACTRAPRAVDGREHGEDSDTTQSCNTVVSNDNTDKFKPLRFGIDSLYLSYHGKLADEWNIKLDNLKTIAQSEDEAEQALAQVSIGRILKSATKACPASPMCWRITAFSSRSIASNPKRCQWHMCRFPVNTWHRSASKLPK